MVEENFQITRIEELRNVIDIKILQTFQKIEVNLHDFRNGLRKDKENKI
jgi:hypothetical protein